MKKFFSIKKSLVGFLFVTVVAILSLSGCGEGETLEKPMDTKCGGNENPKTTSGAKPKKLNY